MTTSIFDVIDIEEKLGVIFNNKSILKEAFTHSSYANEKKLKSNESLEFFGDSVLGFIISEHLYQSYPSAQEGALSIMRANAVAAKPLSETVVRLKLSEHIFLGAGESKSERSRENIYADLFEAIVAAIYIDKDIASAKRFVLGALKGYLTEPKKVQADAADSKTALQELVQRRKGKIRYEQTAKKGPDHDPIFTFSVVIDDKIVASGSGKSKKDAQQLAANEALKKIR